jgi:hypothetical protein
MNDILISYLWIVFTIVNILLFLCHSIIPLEYDIFRMSLILGGATNIPILNVTEVRLHQILDSANQYDSEQCTYFKKVNNFHIILFFFFEK